MKKYWIDFSGYLCVEAENETKAEQEFWRLIHSKMDLTYPFSDDDWGVDGIEERDDGSNLLDTVYTAKDIEDFWYER